MFYYVLPGLNSHCSHFRTNPMPPSLMAIWQENEQILVKIWAELMVYESLSMARKSYTLKLRDWGVIQNCAVVDSFLELNDPCTQFLQLLSSVKDQKWIVKLNEWCFIQKLCIKQAQYNTGRFRKCRSSTCFHFTKWSTAQNLRNPPLKIRLVWSEVYSK